MAPRQVDRYPEMADMDLESAILAADLECEDIQETLGFGNFTKTEARTHHDRHISLQVYRNDLQTTRDLRASRRLQESLYSAMLSDVRVLAAERVVEEQAISDRNFAARLGGHRVPSVPARAQAQISGQMYDDEYLAQLDNEDILMPAEFRPNRHENTNNANVERLHGPANRNLQRYLTALHEREERQKNKRVDCSICFDSVLASQSIRLQCNHTWCEDCITAVFEKATISEGSWPPRCCNQAISNESAQPLLDDNLQGRYAAKSLEWSTRDRTYCHNERCSAFIPPATIEFMTTARCRQCPCITCARCKMMYHGGECERPRLDAQVQELAQQRGWQHCPSCFRVIELTIGCNHIS